MSRLSVVVAAAAAFLVASASTAVASTPPIMGTFRFDEEFTVQPGEPGSCTFPVTIELHGGNVSRK